jgi:hypothetical protein
MNLINLAPSIGYVRPKVSERLRRSAGDRGLLEKLGMPEYGERFAENDIDASVLPHLTDQSLKELGASLVHWVQYRDAKQPIKHQRARNALLDVP